MSRSKFVFRVRDVIRFVMKKSSLNWKEYTPYIKLVSNAFKRERKRVWGRKNIHIFAEMEFDFFVFGCVTCSLLIASPSFSLCASLMSHHLLSWILVFSRIAAISRNDSSFVCFISTFFCCCSSSSCHCWYHCSLLLFALIAISFHSLFIAYSIETT